MRTRSTLIPCCRAGWRSRLSLRWHPHRMLNITGAVRDSSGAVIPGVAVEASSPALIEKTRTVFTIARGSTESSRCVPVCTRSRSRWRASDRRSEGIT